ncbi:asparaginase [Bartonella vinsonii]|uniref:L-asparaginase n=1 Tax=Bartonella vinsonii subsp. berkhoffii str. Tweed TaxID=1094502 RepID=N6VMZ2_BARVB|nr:asparaginase [Bartonella vinsonii]AGF75338.1 L-asparaginase [Bartonella vinsonii subsp. berkhoffii str. Winnie]ENN95255.1 L-asparaginase [Bartonella vinsonii subsp. berkhoffii str. Tweed]
MKKIAIGTLGGTIAMAADNLGQMQPTLTSDILIKSVPDLNKVAHIHAQTLTQLPSGSLSFKILFEIIEWATQQIKAGAEGIVLTQGTDTLEETAFFLSLYWDKAEPLVITGAMRIPCEAGADGPANILAATRVAAHPQSRNRGVLVVINDTIHSPYWVQKSHTVKIETFQSGLVGILGTLLEGKLLYFNNQIFFPRTFDLPQNYDHQVALLYSSLSSDTQLMKFCFESGHYAGLVVAGFGSGHCSFEEADIIRQYTQKMPIIIASRTCTGSTTRKTYGYKGSEVDMIASGALMSGYLSAVKARLLLWAFLAQGYSLAQINAQWNDWTIS